MTTTQDPDDSNAKSSRTENPSGWLALTRNDSVPYVVDALLDLPAHREFNQTELAEFAGVSRQSIHRHIDLLLDAGIVEPVENTSPQRYRFDEDSEVSRALVRLDGAMNAAGENRE